MSAVKSELRGGLSIVNAGKVYNPGANAVVALEECSLDIKPGEFAAIVGPSGCGKSTLLNIIAGFDHLTGGSIALDGKPFATADLSPPPGPDRVVVFQNGALFPWMNVLDNVIYGPTRQRVLSVEDARAKAMDMLEQCQVAVARNREHRDAVMSAVGQIESRSCAVDRDMGAGRGIVEPGGQG